MMTDFSRAIKSNSDQLNACDLVRPRVVTITRIIDKQGQDPKQPMWIEYEGCMGAPYKPSLGMRKILVGVWGDGEQLDTDACIGRQLELYNEPTVKYAGKEQGGIRICGMSHIAGNFTTKIRVNKAQTDDIKVRKLEPVTLAEYPQKTFESALPKMTELLTSGEWTLQQIVAKCQETGVLSREQLAELKRIAPIEEEQTTTGDPI